MLETLKPLPADPLLGITTAFRADPDPSKVDLGVGVYRDDHGVTPIMAAVRESERRIVEKGTTKVYVGPAGNREFAAAMEELTLGAGHAASKAGRTQTLQAPGGCGALRLAAEVLKASGATDILVSDPTWANHVPLLGSAGLKLGTYPYFDAKTGSANVDALLETLKKTASGTVILLQGSCHNPTGADLDRAAWGAVADVLAARGLVPLVDIAYQGLGDGLDEDAYGVRLLADKLPEMLVAVSCSKNFGLYRERVGVLHIVAEDPDEADIALTHEVRIARRLYSMPPDHGAAIVATVLGDESLERLWRSELAAMRERIAGLRRDLVSALHAACPGRDFRFITAQRGMFSFLGLTAPQVRRLRSEHHVYMTEDSRINIAGLRTENVGYFAQAVAQVLRAQAA